MMVISSINAIKESMTLAEYNKAREVYEEVSKVDNTPSSAIALFYYVGIAEGKRMERARRKGKAHE